MNIIRKAPITVMLIAINVIMLFITEISGQGVDVLMKMGAAYTPAIIDGGEYYRLLTSMFLHFNFEHLLNNMLVLFFSGEIIEGIVGKVRYLTIYLLGGILGNILSIAMDLGLPVSKMPISAGASGAVFALIGAMVYLWIINKWQMASVIWRRFVIIILISVWDGFRNTNIDGAAHIGGLIGGFLLTLAVYRKPKTSNYHVGGME